MRMASVLLASLFSSLCSGASSPGSTHSDSGTSPDSGSSMMTPSLPNPYARCFQINPEHTGSIAGPLAPPLVQLWSVPTEPPNRVAGETWAPIVTNGRVYIVTPESEAAALHAFDENTGTDTWAPVMVPQDAMGIAFNDGIVVVSTASGTLLAFDAGTGKQLWSKGIGDTNPAVQAPTMANGLVYVGDMAKGGYLYALKEKTGDQLWKAAPVLVFYDLGFGPISVTDTLVVVQSDGGEIRALDPTMGTPLWNTLSNAFAGGPTAIYAQAAFGQVTNKTVNSYKVGDGTPIQKGFPTDLPAAFDGPNGYFVDTQTGTLTAQTLSSGSVAWTFPGDGVLYESPLIVNGLVYATGGPRMASATQQLNGVLFAVSEATGTLIWSATDLPWTPPRTNPWNTSLSGGDSNGIGNIYVGMGSDGTILVVPTPYGLIAYGPPSAVPPPDAGPADAGESDGG